MASPPTTSPYAIVPWAQLPHDIHGPRKPVPAPKDGRHRRTHAKSRDGCQECKKKHQKCDQRRPKCGKCLARNENCEYPPNAVVRPVEVPNVMVMTPSTSFNDRFYRAATEYYTSLLQNNGHEMTLPTVHLPEFLRLSRDYAHVRSALLRLWAAQNGSGQRSRFYDKLSLEYRQEAVSQLARGLDDAVFYSSIDNMDAALATSLLLVYASLDRDEERKHAGGIKDILDKMGPWQMHSSLKAHVVMDQELDYAPVGEKPLLAEIVAQLKAMTRYYHDNEELLAETKLLRDALLNLQEYFRTGHIPERSSLNNVIRLWNHIKPDTYMRLTEADPDLMLVVAYFDLVTGVMRVLVKGPSYGLPVVGKMQAIQRNWQRVMSAAGSEQLARQGHDYQPYANKLMHYQRCMALPMQLAEGYLLHGPYYFLN